jgi:hypothetical protein
MIAFSVACVVFGAVFAYTPRLTLAIREGFAFFWLTLGVCLFVSTFGISHWLGQQNEKP